MNQLKKLEDYIYYHEDGPPSLTIYHGDCLEIMPLLPKVDLVVTDPPYGIEFMGKDWDKGVPGVHFWTEMIRVLKPGGHLLAFGGTRTYHRMAVAIEDAGFEIRDMIEWVYGSGFPKSLNIGKNGGPEGWGTALKPAHEPICMARKPLSEKTVAENCLKYGTGGINIDESRVKTTDKQGRFPANLIHDNSEEVRECFPEAGKGNGKGAYSYAGREYDNKETSMFNGDKPQAPSNFNDSGNASRFFKSIIYQAKASKSERKLEDGSYSTHPTVKPIALMEYLIKMVSKEGALVLEPFLGSGTTLVACKELNRNGIGIEINEKYCQIAKTRLQNTTRSLF